VGRRKKKEECGFKRLDRDIISLLETMSDELDAISNEGRKRHPEQIVGEELRDATFLVKEIFVDEDTTDDVENKTNENEDEHNTSESNSASILDTDTTARSMEDSCLHCASVNRIDVINNCGVRGLTADNVNGGSTLGTSVTDTSASVFDSHTLARFDTSLGDFVERLCGKSTVAISEVKRSTLTDRRSRITISVSVSTKIEESHTGTISAGTVHDCVRILRIMVEGSKVETIRLMSTLVCDGVDTVIGDCSSDHNQKRKDVCKRHEEIKKKKTIIKNTKRHLKIQKKKERKIEENR